MMSLSSSNSDEGSVNEESIRDIARGLLEDIPMRFIMIRWLDKSDKCSWVLIAGNQIQNCDYKEQTEAKIGKRMLDAYEGLPTSLCDLWCHVSTTGQTAEYTMLYKDAHMSEETVVVCKYIAMPHDTILAVYEDMRHVTDMETKEKDSAQRMDFLLERAVDVMVQADGIVGPEDDWTNQALKCLFNFSSQKTTSNVLVEEFEKNCKVISMADVETLVRNLSSSTNTDDRYTREFLLSYRHFIAPNALMNKMIMKFLSDAGSDKEKQAAQDKVMKVLKIWICEHPYDFDSHPELLRTLQPFIRNSLMNSAYPNLVAMGHTLNKLLTKYLQSDDEAENKNDNFDILVLSRERLHIMDIAPEDVAQQMTLLAFERIRLIKPVEFYGQAWSKRNASTTAPNIVALIAHFNKMTNWISSEILVCKTLKKRTAALKYFIAVAWAAYAYRDYETTFAVCYALIQRTIARLSETWKNLDAATKQTWLILHEFTSFEGNFRKYRRKLRLILSDSPTSSGNFLPYVGLHLKDLTMLEENSNITQIGAVNFHKMRKVANCIQEIQKAQTSIFAFPKNVKVLNHLTSEVMQYDEDARWNMSKICEPESSGEEPFDICAAQPAPNRFTIRRRSSSFGSAADVVVQTLNPIFGVKLSPSSKRKSLTFQPQAGTV
eukprot:TRINITY_DN867_c0_g1_i1.p1 TRINITY_DN867_c0_g1~~TRINITY_DN867_c0_g1_i1.p1  ORF type:complete len:660 (-),score=137.11 TRINITY_DN867_c0_g1_i1:31-2010(-)